MPLILPPSYRTTEKKTFGGFHCHVPCRATTKIQKSRKLSAATVCRVAQKKRRHSSKLNPAVERGNLPLEVFTMTAQTAHGQRPKEYFIPKLKLAYDYLIFHMHESMLHRVCLIFYRLKLQYLFPKFVNRGCLCCEFTTVTVFSKCHVRSNCATVFTAPNMYLTKNLMVLKNGRLCREVEPVKRA